MHPCTPCPPSHCLALINKICRFSSADVQPFAPQILDVLLSKIGVQNSTECKAENEFLRRCACAFRALCVVSDQCPSQVLRELSSPRKKRSSGSTSTFCRGSSISYAVLINASSKEHPIQSYPVHRRYCVGLNRHFRVCSSFHLQKFCNIDRALFRTMIFPGHP